MDKINDGTSIIFVIAPTIALITAVGFFFIGKEAGTIEECSGLQILGCTVIVHNGDTSKCYDISLKHDEVFPPRTLPNRGGYTVINADSVVDAHGNHIPFDHRTGWAVGSFDSQNGKR